MAMSCPKFDRNNKKHVIVAASVGAGVVLILVIIIVVVFVLPGSDDPFGGGGGYGSGRSGLDSDGNDWRKYGLKLHNQYRKKHHAGDLTFSDELNERADKCAQHYAERGVIDHSCRDKGGAGENLFQGEGTCRKRVLDDGIEGWYNEVKDYDFQKAPSGAADQFTQLVWKASKQFGLGQTKKNGKVYMVALYRPAGNDASAMQENVEAA